MSGEGTNMAENESLDLMNRNSRRWFHLYERVLAGADDEEVCDKVIRNIYKTFRKVQEQVPLEGFISCAVDCKDMSELVRDADGHDFARLVELEARPFDSPAALMERVVEGTVDRYLHQIGVKAVGKSAIQNFHQWRERVHRLKTKMRDALKKLASKLATNPSVHVRTPARNASQIAAMQSAILSMSLAGGRRPL